MKPRDPARTPELETFVTFVKRHINIIVTAAATPVAGFFELVPPPRTAGDGKFIAVMSAIVCALVLLALFWRRYAFVKKFSDKWLVGGIIVAILGLSMLAWYRSLLPYEQTDHAKLVPDILLYLAGFPMFCGGATVVFLYGFVQAEEKGVTFAQIVARLESVHLQHLEVIARAFECANSASLDGKARVPEKVRKAFKESSWSVILEASERMKNLSRGHLEIWGPEMDRVYRNFVEAIRKSFFALSRDDLDFWTKPYSRTYLQLNKNLIDRNCLVERIFLIPQQKVLGLAHQEALREQIELGIRIRIAILEELQTLGIEDKELDFGIFDDFAVSFFRFMHGRLFRLTVDQSEYRKYKNVYERVTRLCVSVPGKHGDNVTLFESWEDLDSWFKHREHTQSEVRNQVSM